MTDPKNTAKYTGIQKFTDTEGGYYLWIPSGWKHIKVKDASNTNIFSPFDDRADTVFMTERRSLKLKVKKEDLPMLKEGFLAGINALPEVEIEKVDETVTEQMLGIEVKFSFKDADQIRIRWMRLVYSGRSLLILSAQGANPEEYALYEPMFFNIMMSTTFI